MTQNETETNLFENLDNFSNDEMISNEMLLSPQTIDDLDQITRTIITRSQSLQSIDYDDLTSNSSQSGNDENYTPSSNFGLDMANDEKVDIFDENFISILDRFNVSNRAAAAVVAAVLSRLERVLNVSLANILCSVSTIHRRRQSGRELIVEKIRQSALSEDYITLHWDGIKTQALQGPGKVHRLVVTLSGKSNKELFMGASICEESAVPIANFIQQQLTEWRLLHKVKALCFDTTYTNSGQRGGVVAFLTSERDLLFCACRHHIAELMLTWIYKKVMITSGTVGPTDSTFKSFAENWKQIKLNPFKTLKDDRNAFEKVRFVLDDLKMFLLDQLENRQPRNDYLTLIKIALIVLVEQNVANNFDWLNELPGISHARWMAKMIYLVLIYLFRDHYQATESEFTPNSIELFVVSGLRIYLKYFLEAPIAIKAPMNDLRLLKELIKFEQVNKDCSKIVFEGLKKHFWYLSEQLSPLAFFDEEIPIAIKNEMRQNYLLKDSVLPNKKKFIVNRETPLSFFYNKRITDFITKGSKTFFQILEISDEFLSLDSSQWKTNSSFIEAKDKIAGLAVVNDSAERGVALAKFSNRTSKKEKFFQNRLSSVVDNRNNVKSFTRSNLLPHQ